MADEMIEIPSGLVRIASFSPLDGSDNYRVLIAALKLAGMMDSGWKGLAEIPEAFRTGSLNWIKVSYSGYGGLDGSPREYGDLVVSGGGIDVMAQSSLVFCRGHTGFPGDMAQCVRDYLSVVVEPAKGMAIRLDNILGSTGVPFVSSFNPIFSRLEERD